MMEQHLRSPALLVFALVVLAACGPQGPRPGDWNPYSADPPRDENYHGGPAAVLRAYDANGDGTLMRDEFLAKLREEFAAADAGHTGCLTNGEVAAINEKRIAT